ncbi:MAG TPA: hypothetical protein VK489_05845 [Ferruginibacter sp.]|nr:hypothetical protein [Ferruginibacter sp.]
MGSDNTNELTISPENIIAQINVERQGISGHNAVIQLKDFDSFRVTKEKHITEAKPVITISGAPVAAPGNITPITAEGKGGKTALVSILLAGAISTTGIIDGFPGVSVLPNVNKKAVIGIDTEQSASDQQYNVKTVLSLAGIEITPEYFYSYNIRTLPLTEYRQFTSSACELCNKEHAGIHLIVLDGGADYITSVNDEADANEFIAYAISLSVKYNCPVILVIHLNENAGKNGDTMPRGHLGRQAIRKGYCQLNITKDADISTLQVLRARKAGSSDTGLIHYRYSKEKGYHVSIDAETVISTKQGQKDMAANKKAEAIASKIFCPPASFTHKNSISEIMKITGKTASTAKRYLNDMIGWDFIEKGVDGNYRLRNLGI